MHNIGDKLYYAETERVDNWVTCPDCMGTKRVRVILGDGTELSLNCEGCRGNLGEGRGEVNKYEWVAKVRPFTVTGISTDFGRTEYNHHPIENVCVTEQAAQARADERLQERETWLQKRADGKTKRHQSWAWHVSYFRDGIRRAEADLAYNKRMLGIATTKSKPKGKG